MARKKRIAIVTHALDLGGGAATMAEFVHRVLRDSARYDVGVISLAQSSSDSASVLLKNPGAWGRSPAIEQKSWRGIAHAHVGVRWPEYEPRRYQARPVLTALLREYDLVQVVAGTPPWACPVIDAGVPCLLWTATTLWADRASRLEDQPGMKGALQRWMARRSEAYEKRALEQSQVVFGLSPYTVDAVRRIAPEANVRMAVAGVDTAHYRPAGAAKQNYILSVARYSDARKNCGMLLTAYRQLLDRVPNAPDLWLVGEAPTPASLAKLAELNLQDRVRVLPPAGPDQLKTLYRDAQFFVLASDEEGLGIVLLEAMASGIPCLVTRCGGPETVIAHNSTGFLTPVRDAAAFAERLEQLVCDPAQRERMGRAARQSVERRFSLAAAGEPFLEEYDRILNSKPRAVAYAS